MPSGMKKQAKAAAGPGELTESGTRQQPLSAIELIRYLIGSDQLLDLILENVSDLIVVLDRDGRRLYNSPSYRAIFGDPEALRGTSSFAEIHPEDRERIRDVFQQTVKTGRGKTARYRFQIANGGIRHIQSRGHIIRDARGEIRYVVVIARDITAQQQVRRRLDETETTFRGLVENSPVGVFILQDDAFVYTNPKLGDISGYGSDELNGGMRLIDLVIPEERDRVRDSLEAMQRGEADSAWCTARVRNKDGALLDMEISGGPTVIGSRTALVGTMLDVTERRQGEALQRAQHQITELASTLSNLPDFYAALHTILGELTYARNFYIALYDRESDEISFPYYVDEIDVPPPTQRPGRGLTELVLRTGRPLLATPEVFQKLVDQGEVELQGGPSIDWLGVPLYRDDRTMGVIVVQSYTRSVRFGPRDQEILTYISKHIAVAIDRKHTSQALRDSEEKYRTIFEGMGDGILMYDHEGKAISWNPSAQRILGETSAGMIYWATGKHLEDPVRSDGQRFSPPEMPTMVTAHTGMPLNDVIIGFLAADGGRRWIEMNTRPLTRPGDHHPYALVATIADITRRTEAENALHQSELRFRSLVEAIPDWIWETDHLGRYVYASPKVTDLLGVPPTEVLGKRFQDILPPGDARRAGEEMARLMRTRRPFAAFQHTHARPDGRTVVLESSGVPVFDHQGTFRGYRGIDRDITARRQDEEELARLKMAVEQAAESIVITEPDARIVYVNPAFESVTGYSRSEVVGSTPNVLRSGAHGADFFENLWGSLKRGEVWSGRITNKRKDGTSIEEEMTISPVRDAAGNVVNFVAVQRDITRELEMERRLLQTQKMESLGQLAGGIAHDFNNVLGVIQGGLSLLKKKLPDPSLLRYTEVAEVAVARGADVAKRLLAFSREGQITLRPISLVDVVNEITSVLQHTIEKTIAIVTDVPDTIPSVEGDPGQLYQVLLNLCINGRDAILDASEKNPDARITISACEVTGDHVRARFKDAAAESYVRISVSDTGSGIPDDVLSRMFEPFFTTKPIGKGTGLGLSVVYGIVQSHRGWIDVETAHGKGSSFHIYLEAAPEQTPVDHLASPSSIPSGSETILVVEDETALRELISELLMSFGYTVLQAADGAEGLETFSLNKDRIQAVITDMGLPRMSGQDMFEQMRKVDPNSRVILASGYLDPEMKIQLFNEGARAFVQKPYQPDEVLRILRGVIDGTYTAPA
jgi:two-component system, cell cycle sensor histidine kinase and response regulator CckA